METRRRDEKAEELAQDIEGYLQKMIGITAEEPEKRAEKEVGRKKVLPALVLWSSLLVAVLRGFRSQLGIWRLITWQGFWNYPTYAVSDQAVYERLAASGGEDMKRLFEQVRDNLRERIAPYAEMKLAEFAKGVYAIDGSTLDKIARHLPRLRGVKAGDGQMLGGKMLGVFDIRRQQWQEMLLIEDANENEKKQAATLLNQIVPGSMILADLGFFSFRWFDMLTDRGYWWLSRLRAKVTYQVIHTYYQGDDLFDGIVWLGKYRADKAAYAVRLVQFKMGKTKFEYITNVLDPRVLSIHEIAVLYARRWDIELAFKMVKQYLQLHILWSAQPVVIVQQLWAVLIISQVLQAIRLEIAGLAQVDPFDVSLALVTQYVPQLAFEGKNPIKMIIEDGRRVGIIRPSRRIRPQTPAIDLSQMNPLPRETQLTRTPRYAQRKCDSASHQKAKKNAVKSP